MKHIWLYISSGDLRIEKEQLIEEGKDVSSVEEEFDELLDIDPQKELELQPRLQKLLDRTVNLPMRSDYAYHEPSDIEEIKECRPEGVRKFDVKLDEDVLADKLLGAWLGRCSGCLLGKPVEGWRTDRMWGYLKDLDRYPLNNYFTSDVPDDIKSKYHVSPYGAFVDRVAHMPEDDDTNYTTLGLALLERYGKDFTPSNVADFWMENLPILHTCTAERVAYRNFAQLIYPPKSAVYRNPYREWIGAQIRADMFGYVAIGNPELAAEFAWRDACISHIKNGIYGEMWVAAMLAAAGIISDTEEIIRIGLSEIPSNSRLAEAIGHVLEWYKEDIDYEEAIHRVHQRWNEHSGHHWCHTISNAQIVALGLLWGEKDFEKSICYAVQACFDTDCNGATVGSLVGMILGARELPSKWISPLNDKIATGVSGYNLVKISDVAEATRKLSIAINQ